MSNKFSKQLKVNEQKAKITVDLSSSDAQPDVLDSNSYFADEKVVKLDCSQIERDPDQPRKLFDSIELEAFYQDILTNGQLSPIIVRRTENGKLIIKYGERRWRAISLSKGNLKIKAIIVNDDNDAFKLRLSQIAENEVRKNLAPFELAESYYNLVELGNEKGLTIQKIADMLHISRTKLTKFLSIYKSTNLRSFIENPNNKKINDVEVLYNLAILEKDNPEIFDNQNFVDKLNNEDQSIRQIINEFKDTAKNEKIEESKKVEDVEKTDRKGKIKKSATTINCIDLNVLDDSNFLLTIDNKEFYLSQELAHKIKKILNET